MRTSSEQTVNRYSFREELSHSLAILSSADCIVGSVLQEGA